MSGTLLAETLIHRMTDAQRDTLLRWGVVEKSRDFIAGLLMGLFGDYYTAGALACAAQAIRDGKTDHLFTDQVITVTFIEEPSR